MNVADEVVAATVAATLAWYGKVIAGFVTKTSKASDLTPRDLFRGVVESTLHDIYLARNKPTANDTFTHTLSRVPGIYKTWHIPSRDEHCICFSDGVVLVVEANERWIENTHYVYTSVRQLRRLRLGESPATTWTKPRGGLKTLTDVLKRNNEIRDGIDSYCKKHGVPLAADTLAAAYVATHGLLETQHDHHRVRAIFAKHKIRFD